MRWWSIESGTEEREAKTNAKGISLEACRETWPLAECLLGEIYRSWQLLAVTFLLCQLKLSPVWILLPLFENLLSYNILVKLGSSSQPFRDCPHSPSIWGDPSAGPRPHLPNSCTTMSSPSWLSNPRTVSDACLHSPCLRQRLSHNRHWNSWMNNEWMSLNFGWPGLGWCHLEVRRGEMWDWKVDDAFHFRHIESKTQRTRTQEAGVRTAYWKPPSQRWEFKPLGG